MNKTVNQPTANVTPDTQATKDRKSIDQLKSYKKHWEPRWYLAQAFYEGVHFTYPKKDSTGNWQRRNEVGKNKVLREIPKAKKQLDSVRNLILKLRQKPVVYPDKNIIIAQNGDNEEARDNETKKAEMQGRYMEYYLNDVMKLSRHKKKLIKNAELYHVSFIQILNDNGKYEFAVYSPFEISIFPSISNINEYPIVAKHVPKRFEDLIGNELYDQTVITELKDTAKDGKFSASLYQDAYLKERYGNAPDDNVIVDELYQIKRVTVDEAGQHVADPDLYVAEYQDSIKQYEGKFEEDGVTPVAVPPMGKIKEVERLTIRAYIGTKKVRDEVTNLSMIPISMFCWGDEAYATSLMEDLMPLNKAYDVFISKLEHKAKKMDTGRYTLQKGEDAKILTTNDGEFVRFKRFKPELMAEASVPNAFMEAINLVEGDMREQGVSMTSAAGIPQGVEAWHAIESLKEIDYASIGTQADNLNECLTDLTEKLTEMIAYDMTTIENVSTKGADGKQEAFRVVGKRGADILSQQGAIPQDVVVIDPNRSVKVEIESEITWTEEGKRNLVLDLIKEGILPKEMGLEALKFGNTKDILQKLISEATFGKSMIDAADFKVLPVEMQQAILQFLSQGANTGGAIPPAETPVQ